MYFISINKMKQNFKTASNWLQITIVNVLHVNINSTVI